MSTQRRLQLGLTRQCDQLANNDIANNGGLKIALYTFISQQRETINLLKALYNSISFSLDIFVKMTIHYCMYIHSEIYWVVAVVCAVIWK